MLDGYVMKSRHQIIKGLVGPYFEDFEVQRQNTERFNSVVGGSEKAIGNEEWKKQADEKKDAIKG